MTLLPLDALRSLLEHQQHAALRVACQNATTDDPARYLLLILAHLHTGDIALAEQQLALIAPVAEQLDPDARADLAAIYIHCLQVHLATTHLDAVLLQAPEHPMALARRGWCDWVQGDLPTAEQRFRRSAALEPRRIAVRANLADLYLRQNQPEQAQTAVEQARTQLEVQHSALPEAAHQQYQQRLQGLQLQLWILRHEDEALEHWLREIDARGDEADAVHWRLAAAQGLAEQDRHAQSEDVLRQGLQRYPKNTALLLQLSELAQLQGRAMQAALLVRQALAQDPDNAALWARLAQASLQGGGAEARKAADKAIELADAMTPSPEHPSAQIDAIRLQARLALAQVESDEQHFDLAEQLFRDILTQQPRHVAALRALGQQQMQRGRIDEAVSLFEQVRQIDPVSGHTALINARQFPQDVETLEKLDQAARMPSLEGRARSGILFQLAAAWEKRKDYEKAYAYAREANELSKRFLHYDPKAHRNRCARIRHGFSKSLYDHRRDCGIESGLPVFVLGMPRSGTTLVEQIIAGHSQIFGAGELGVIPNVIQGLERWERHTGSGRHYPDCVDDLTAFVTKGIAENVLKELKAHAPDAKHIVDKLPHNFENIGLIKFLFPRAKIISVRRDSRDIALSNYFTDYQAKHGGMGFAYDLTWIGEQLADHNLLMHHWQQVFPGEILEVQYEHVVENTEREAHRVLEYIGVPWEAQVLNFNELDRPVKTASVWQVRQPIYKTSKAKWEHYSAHLGPLIQGTNAKITWEPIEMVTLPEPGLLQAGFALCKEGQLDQAEYKFKQLLHHLPEHAAAHYMVGEVYLRKNLINDGIAEIERALELAPWKRAWTRNLLMAYGLTKQDDKAEALKQKYRLTSPDPEKQDGLVIVLGPEPVDDDELFERMLALAPAKTAQPDQQMLSEIAQAIGVNTDTREVAMLPSGKG